MSSISPQNKTDKNLVSRRTAILGAGGVGVFGILGARLYQLQVLQAEDYKTLSDNNRFNFNLLLPVRGEIRDRFGIPLARNEQNYRVIIIPERTTEIEKTLDRVSRISPISLGQHAVARRYFGDGNSSRFEPRSGSRFCRFNTGVFGCWRFVANCSYAANVAKL